MSRRPAAPPPVPRAAAGVAAAETGGRRKPDQLDAHLNPGKALYEAGRLKESGAHSQAALTTGPGDEKARVPLGKLVEQPRA